MWFLLLNYVLSTNVSRHHVSRSQRCTNYKTPVYQETSPPTGHITCYKTSWEPSPATTVTVEGVVRQFFYGDLHQFTGNTLFQQGPQSWLLPHLYRCVPNVKPRRRNRHVVPLCELEKRSQRRKGFIVDIPDLIFSKLITDDDDDDDTNEVNICDIVERFEVRGILGLHTKKLFSKEFPGVVPPSPVMIRIPNV